MMRPQDVFRLRTESCPDNTYELVGIQLDRHDKPSPNPPSCSSVPHFDFTAPPTLPFSFSFSFAAISSAPI